ncbi:hypothetical protein ACQVP2_31790 [Methylobacterium aquaticum]|uniref:hypothetical protein n=1 Tax=Methylobacterium aquaticum TaxID=270351 RepID=UPI003D186BF2
MWRLFDAKIFERLGDIRGKNSEAAELAAILRHNLELLGDSAGPLRERHVAEIELEVLRVELLEIYETVASLVVDLEFERARVSYLEERLAEFEDAAEAAQRSRPVLKIVAFSRIPRTSESSTTP